MKRLLLIMFIIPLCGCATAGPLDMITPTIVPPLAEELGYNVPNIKGVTTVGIVKGILATEKLRLEALDSSARLTLTATEGAVNGTLGLLTALGIPVAGAFIPRVGEKKRIDEALRKEPPKE